VDASFRFGYGPAGPGKLFDIPLTLYSSGAFEAISFSIDFDEDVFTIVAV
jgi:hypothetical protein